MYMEISMIERSMESELKRCSMAALAAPRASFVEPLQLFAWKQEAAWFLSCTPWRSEHAIAHSVFNARVAERVMQLPTPPQSCEIEISSVPPALLRDHAILHGLCLALQPLQEILNAKISLNEIVAAVRSMAPFLARHSDSSLRQSVRWVCVEVIKRSNAEAPHSQNSCEFSSTRDRPGGDTVGAVLCYGRGACVLFRYAAWCVNEMRYNGEDFLSRWRISRSSKAKAKHAAQVFSPPM